MLITQIYKTFKWNSKEIKKVIFFLLLYRGIYSNMDKKTLIELIEKIIPKTVHGIGRHAILRTNFDTKYPPTMPPITPTKINKVR